MSEIRFGDPSSGKRLRKNEKPDTHNFKPHPLPPADLELVIEDLTPKATGVQTSTAVQEIDTRPEKTLPVGTAKRSAPIYEKGSRVIGIVEAPLLVREDQAFRPETGGVPSILFEDMSADPNAIDRHFWASIQGEHWLDVDGKAALTTAMEIQQERRERRAH